METNQAPGSDAEQMSGLKAEEKPVEINVNPEEQTADQGTIYRCKRCRTMVATQQYVVTHEVGPGQKYFSGRKAHQEVDEEPQCTCIFVEPMKWMQTVEEGYVSNKIWCMGCKARLGSFHWAGMRCSCGTLVIPAFKLIKSKIDECQM